MLASECTQFRTNKDKFPVFEEEIDDVCQIRLDVGRTFSEFLLQHKSKQSLIHEYTLSKNLVRELHDFYQAEREAAAAAAPAQNGN